MRSIIDSKSDTSTLWRDIENYDLISTIKENPVFGTGYGHGYLEVIQLPPVDYALERYCPHNSILGLWGYCGYFGYAAMTLLWVVGAYFAMRSYYTAKSPIDRAAARSRASGSCSCVPDPMLGRLGPRFLDGRVLDGACPRLRRKKLATASGAWSEQRSNANVSGVL